MKKIFFIPLLSLVVIGSACNSSQNKTNTASESSDTTTIIAKSEDNQLVGQSLQSYFILKDKLVLSNAADAKIAAGKVYEELSAIKGFEETALLASKIANTDEIENQREIFSTLSNDMIDLVKNSIPKGEKIFVQFCPMANNNNGGYWLSAQEKIENPYYGDAMLTCGVVKEVLN